MLTRLSVIALTLLLAISACRTAPSRINSAMEQGSAAFEARDYGTARGHFQEAAELARRTPGWAATAMQSKQREAMCAEALGDAAGREAALVDAVALAVVASEDPDTKMQLDQLFDLALVRVQLGRSADAEQAARRALAIAEKHGSSVGRAHVVLAQVLASAGRWSEAEVQYRSVLDSAGVAQNAQAAPLLRELANAVRKQGREAEAAELEANAGSLESGAGD